MTGLDSTKISAAVLTAGILAVGSVVVVDIATHREKITGNAFPIAVAETTAQPTEEAEPSGLEPVLPLLASADVEAGQKVARKCSACHTFEEGGANKIGPNLWNIVGRSVAADGSFGYSAALQEKSAESWSYQNLNAFLGNPKDWAPGTKMSFAGIKKVEDRANLIGYLRSLSASPAALPTAEEIEAAAGASGGTRTAAVETVSDAAETAAEAVSEAAETAVEAVGEAAETAAEAVSEAAETAAETAAEAVSETVQTATAPAAGLGELIAAASGEEGEKVARICKACHTFDKGGANKIGPNLWGVLGRNFAGHEGFKYSNAMSKKSGETWSFEAMDEFLAKPRDYLPGTKMAFPGLKKPEDRAALLAYLREMSDAPLDLPQ